MPAVAEVYGRRTSAAYDEVLTEVAARASTTRSIGKSDIGALLMWRRLRADTPWVRRLLEPAHRHRHPWIARDVDLALYWLGANR